MRVHVDLRLSAWTLAMPERQSWPNVRAKALRSSRRYRDSLARWSPAVFGVAALLGRFLPRLGPLLGAATFYPGARQAAWPSRSSLQFCKTGEASEVSTVTRHVRLGSGLVRHRPSA